MKDIAFNIKTVEAPIDSNYIFDQASKQMTKTPMDTLHKSKKAQSKLVAST